MNKHVKIIFFLWLVISIIAVFEAVLWLLFDGLSWPFLFAAAIWIVDSVLLLYASAINY